MNQVFERVKPGYPYPLLKTTFIPFIQSIPIFNIPVHSLQTEGNITTSKITAFLKYIFQLISAKFCQADINEYC